MIFISGSTYGNIFKITSWGESHQKGIGVVIDGCPAGILLNEFDIQKELNKRKPNSSKYTTKRAEDDIIEIMSGVFEGKTTGTPISLIVFNKDHNSKDYSHLKDIYRPSHSDYSYDKKYGFRDYLGGGRASGRETIARVCAGAVAKKVLEILGISILAYTKSIGKINCENIDLAQISENPLLMPSNKSAEKAINLLEETMKKGDSLGGIIHCKVNGLKAGIGEPVFDKLDACISKAILSIGATKGIEFGLGFNSSKLLGSEYNDEFFAIENEIFKKSNNSGGILGGISDGFELNFNVAFKPTPSISLPQNSINKNYENINIEIKGRHDPCIVPRAVPIVESMCAITILDYILINMTKKIDCIKSAYFNF